MKKSTGKGLFIVLEGIDGAGTTTQCQQLADWLRGRGELAHLTREPSDGPIGTMLRQVLSKRLQAKTMSGDNVSMDPATVALLFAADRLDHLQNEVVPYTEAGYHVVCDRYVLSSLAYQSVGVDMKFVRQINDKALAPDLTVFLQVSPEVAMQRIDANRPGRDVFETLGFQRKVAAAYDEVVKAYRGGRVETLDGEMRPDTVFARLRGIVGDYL